MSNKTTPHYADQKGTIATGFDRNTAIAEGDTVPTDGAAGYAPGSLFLKRAGTSGAALYINEGTATSCDFNPLKPQGTGAGAVVGVGSGYKVARGEIALDGSNPTPVATGLTTIVSAIAVLKRTTALSSGTAFVTVDFTGSDGTLNLYGWVLAGTASSGTETVEWIAFGT